MTSVKLDQRDVRSDASHTIGGTVMSDIVRALEVLRTGRIVDLTHTVHTEIPRFGPFPKMTLETLYTVPESGFHVERVSFVTQYGTHLDAPEHFVENRRRLDAIDLDELMLPLYVLHFEKEVAENPDFIVTPEHLAEWEARNGRIPEGAFVAFASNWSKRWASGDMTNKDADGVAHSPGWGLDTLKILFEDRKVTAIGHEMLDTDASSDVIRRGFLDCEKYVLDTDHYQVELMCNLDQLPETGGVIFVGVPKFKDLPGFPVRAWAIVPQ